MFDVPQEYLSARQYVQVQTAKTQAPYYDHESVQEFLDSLWYPLYFLDFETSFDAIPPL